MSRILIVEDEFDIGKLIQTTLHKEGITEVKIATTIADGWELFQSFQPHLAILDIMLPDGEGYDLCKKIRQESTIPVLFLSAKSEEIDKLLGLAIGGDDYITKPFSPKELAYRVKAQLRRAAYTTSEQTATSKKVGIFAIHENGTEVSKNEEKLQLTAKELGLMQCFLRNPNQILSKELLFETVWKEDFYGAENTLMVHIRRLREKVEEAPSQPKHIITVKGLGYRFIPEKP